MLKVVKWPMKKNYYYFYTLNDMEQVHSELLEVDSCFPDENDTYRDIILYLDRQNFDIRSSVISRLIEYAGQQVKTGCIKAR